MDGCWIDAAGLDGNLDRCSWTGCWIDAAGLMQKDCIPALRACISIAFYRAPALFSVRIPTVFQH